MRMVQCINNGFPVSPDRPACAEDCQPALMPQVWFYVIQNDTRPECFQTYATTYLPHRCAKHFLVTNVMPTMHGSAAFSCSKGDYMTVRNE